MNEREYVELRSEDVQEILGTPPGRLVRWGTTIVFLGFIALIATAWFVRYPDVVGARAVITTTILPADVAARMDGKIARVLTSDRANVREGQLLAVMQTSANYAHVLELDMAVDAWQGSRLDSLKLVKTPTNLLLGELQVDYADFVADLDAFQFGKNNRSSSIRSNIGSIQQQINQLEQSILFDQKALRRTGDQLKTAEEFYQNQKKLYEEGITSRADFERERTKLAEFERLRDQYEENILRKRNEIIALKSGINSASLGGREDASNTATALLNSLGNLRSKIETWKQNYLVTAPIDGRINIHLAGTQQFVRQGEVILTVVPPEGNKIVARVTLPLSGSGKVKPGQKVLLKLDSYPYHEFGALEGKVESKALVPKDNNYMILVDIPVKENNELRTTYNKKIPFEQQLQARADIITEDKGFLERIADQVFAKL